MRARVRHIKGRQFSGAGWFLMCHLALADLPPPAAMMALPGNAPAETTLYLDLTVNGQRAGKVIPVRQTGRELHIRTSDLHAAGVSIPAAHDANASWLSLDRTPGVQYRYDSNSLLLEVMVPAHWFTEQHLGGRRQETLQAVSGAGLALNYAAHVIDGEDPARSGSLWSEWRMFNASGVLINTGVHRYVDEGEESFQSGARRRGYVRFDTAWSSSNEDRLQSWIVGDLITSSQSWSAPARLAGIKFSRDFRLRPDLITYPLPQFSGRTDLPSTLELFIDGRRVRTEQLRPGPYTITSVPFVTGAGEATLVTTDVLGREVATTLPFYASSDLLRAGLVDYSVSLGAMRRDYGIENFSYGRFAGVGSLRVGATDAITLEGEVALAEPKGSRYSSFGLGSVMNVRLLGVVNGSVSRSAVDNREGWQWTFGYRYANRGFNFAYQGARGERDYVSLANSDLGPRGFGVISSDIVTAGWSAERIGSLGISLIRVETVDDAPTRFLNVAHVKHLWSGLSLRIGASRDLRTGDDMFMAHLLASLGPRGNVSLGMEEGDSSRRHVRLARSLPSHGGFGWNMGHVENVGGRTHTDASLAWSSRYVRFESGLATDTETSIGWADLRGSLLVMDDEVFAARQVSDAFVVVSTDGLADVPVRYENQLVGYTNQRGRLLVPWVASHYAARFSIDPVDLPPEISITDPERRLAVKRRSGALLSFDMQRTSSALIKLVDGDGNVVPVGSHVHDRRSGQAATVGYDGLVYFENPSARIELEVRRADGGTCYAELDFQPSVSAPTQLGAALCRHTP